MKMKLLRMKSVMAGIFLFLLPFIVSGQTFFLTVPISPVPPAAREKSLFALVPGLFNHYGDDNGLFSRCYWAGPGRMSNRAPIADKPRVSTGKVIGEIFMGVVGNLAGGYAGAIIGYNIDTKIGDEWSFEGLGGTLLGYSAGSTFGSALGVYLTGNTGNAKGSFGRALLGSFLGEVAAAAVSLAVQDGTAAVISFVILPPIGAALFFNSSLRYKSLPGSNALLNFNKSEFRIGIPYVHIQPLRCYAKSAKPEVRFSINLLNIAF
jgi:hypothetical protein